MTVTNGSVEYARTVKPADYESKSAKVALSFAVDEGSDPAAVVSKVYDLAMNEVHRRLGLPAPAGYVPGDPNRAGQTIVAEPVLKKPTAKKLEAAAVPVENPTTIVVPSAANNPEPAAIVTAAPSEPTSEPTDDPLTIVAPEPLDLTKEVLITDVDLRAAANQAVEKKVPASFIHELTRKFTGVVGRSMTSIPMEQRAEFLKQLRDLHP